MPGLEQKIVKEHSFFSTLRYARVKKESQRNVRNLKKILEGKKKQALKNLKREMKDASKVKDYERAAKVRDRITALEKVLSHDKIFAWPESEVIQLRRSPRLYDWRETEKKLGGIFKTGKKISRIEAYDVSNIQGQSATGSMVAFVNGEPNKNFYRRFRIRTEGKPDDVAMLKEVLTRRFSHREWGLPDLILIDGGKAQMNAAVSSIKYKASGIKIPVTAIAKRENKLFIEEKKQPVLLKDLPRDVFNLILQLRDEAHRFALSYHRKLREKF
jgi:excinuclease ABC subunit C